MIRNLVFLLFACLAFFTGIFFAYGEINPCRALAIEESRRSAMPENVAGLWSRVQRSDMAPLACSEGLLLSWYDRLLDDAHVRHARYACR